MADDYAYDEADYMEDTRECEAMRKLFVGGLSKETSKETLESYFSQYGTLVDHNIAIDKKSKKSRGFGFVTFETSGSVEKVFGSRPHVIEGAALECKRSLPKEMGPPATKLFIGGMSQEVDPEEFKEYIKSRHSADIGTITKLDVVIDKQTGRHKGFAFIECSSIDFADRLVLSESEIELCGRSVSIRKRNSEQPANAGQKTPVAGNEIVGTDGEDMRECEAMRKLFVGGLSKETKIESLESHFSQYGTLVDHNIAMDKKSKLSRGFGFVTFESSDSAEKVLTNRPHVLDGSTLTCKRSLPKECGPPSTRLFVGGMSQEVVPEQFKEYIKSRHPEDLGKITRLDIIINKQTGVHKGFAFIECSSNDFADRLVLSEGSFDLCGRHLSITKKNSEQKESGNPSESGSPPGRYINPRAAQMDAFDGQPSIRLFVGGVSQEVQPAALLQYIESRYPPSMGGLITKIDVMIDKQSGKHKGFAFAECNSEELADVLCKNETKFELNGRSLSIQRRSDDKGSKGGASGDRGGRRDAGRGGGYAGQNGGYGGQPGGFGGQSGGFGGQSGGFGGQSGGFGGQSGGFGGQSAGFGGQSAGFGGQSGGFGGQHAGFGGQPGGGFGGQSGGFVGPGGNGGQPGGTGGIGRNGQGKFGNQGGYGAAQNSFEPGDGRRW